MAILDILTLPDAALKQVSEPVTEFDQALRAFIDDLEETRRNG
ncbi:MAG: peptide deformylase, partial [Chromatiaceae bacterium]|nr:peptide deformylase [Chromatiaceae bacterium]